MNTKTKLITKIIISATILIITGKMIYNRFTVYLYKDTYIIKSENEIKKEDQVKSPEIKIENSSATSTMNKSQENIPKIEKQNETIEQKQNIKNNDEKKQENKNYKITIRYSNKHAKRVKISGSFFAWKERDMKKEGGEWIINLILKEQGEYKYYFIVDGKRVLDPKAKKSKDGNYSILEVR
jgi:hypothetical protein